MYDPSGPYSPVGTLLAAVYGAPHTPYAGRTIYFTEPPTSASPRESGVDWYNGMSGPPRPFGPSPSRSPAPDAPPGFYEPPFPITSWARYRYRLFLSLRDNILQGPVTAEEMFAYVDKQETALWHEGRPYIKYRSESEDPPDDSVSRLRQGPRPNGIDEVPAWLEGLKDGDPFEATSPPIDASPPPDGSSPMEGGQPQSASTPEENLLKEATPFQNLNSPKGQKESLQSVFKGGIINLDEKYADASRHMSAQSSTTKRGMHKWEEKVKPRKRPRARSQDVEHGYSRMTWTSTRKVS